jgi:hypothetical protein
VQTLGASGLIVACSFLYAVCCNSLAYLLAHMLIHLQQKASELRISRKTQARLLRLSQKVKILAAESAFKDFSYYRFMQRVMVKVIKNVF